MSVALERRGAVAWLRVSNPPTHLLRAHDLGALRRHLVALESDDEVRVVVLAGGPGCTPRQLHPGDALAMAQAAPPYVPPRLVFAAVALLRRVPMLQRVVDRLPTPHVAFLDFLLCADVLEGSRLLSVAALAGPVFGGGLELALCCDLRVASDADDTWLAQPEALAGVMAGFGGTQRLPRLVGKARALQLLLLGDAVRPAEAERMGLVQQVVPAATLEEEVQAMAERLASRPTAAALGTHRAVHQGLQGTLARGLAIELGAVQRVWARPEAREGLGKVSTLAGDPSLYELPLPELLHRFEHG